MHRQKATGITISLASNAVDMLVFRGRLIDLKLVVDVLLVGVRFSNKGKKS
jgi:hypothetical protein